MALDKLWRNDIISKFKRNLVILSLLILALCMGVTSAANDVSAESMMICDNNGDALLEVSENIGSADIIGTSGGDNYALGDDSQGNFAELNSTIGAYGDNANILLNKDYVFSDDDIDFNNGIVISHNNLTIDGQGHFIL